MQKISEISTLFDANQDTQNSTPYYILYREGRKEKAKLRQHEQRMIIYKNIEEPLIGGCSASIMICVDIHM